MTSLPRPLAGVALIVVGLGALCGQDAFMKELTERHSAFALLAVRTVFTMLGFRLALLLAGVGHPLSTGRHRDHLARGVTQFLALAAFYLALTVMPLLDVVALFFTAPILATALAAWWLREPVGTRRWIAIAIGFTGAMLTVRPGAGLVQIGSLIAFAAACLYSVSLVLTRRLGDTEPASTTAYYTMLVYLALAWAGVGVIELAGPEAGTQAAVLLKPWTRPGADELAALAIAGSMVALGFFCLAQAYRMAPVSVLAPMEYVALPISGALAYFAWGDVPGPRTLIGAALIIASGVYIARSRAPRREAPPGAGARARAPDDRQA